VLEVTGTPGVTRVITVPNVQKTYTVRNRTANITQIKTSSGTAFDCPALSDSYLVCNGSNGVAGRSITDGANAITSLASPFTSPAFLGTPTAPTAAQGTNTTQLATTAFVNAEIASDTSNLAPKASPAFTGVPTAPTAAVSTNTTQLATTAFVNAEIANDAPTKTGSGASGTWGISVTGNSGTTTALATARTIGGVSFNGTANINLPGVNTAGNQNTSGNAATATTFETARTINGVSFNGSANIIVESYIEDDNTSNSTRYLTFVDNTTANYKRLNEDSNLTYNPSTNTLTAGTFSGALSGNATTATTLQTARTINGTSFNGSGNITTTNWGTARTISFTGDVTGSSSVNGSANVATSMTLANSGVTANTYGANNSIPSLTVDSKGRVTAGSVIVPSGTWGISISGNAQTATSATSATSATNATNASFAITQTAGTNNTTISTTAFVRTAVNTALQAVYPVGSVYINASVTTNPLTLLGFGTWAEIGAGRVLVGQDTGDALFDVMGETGGSKDAIVVTHTHTTASVSTADINHSHSGTTGDANQNHTHGFSGNTNGVGDHVHNAYGGSNAIYTGPTFAFTMGSYNGSVPVGSVIIGAGAHSHSYSGGTEGFSNTHQHAFTTGAMSANATHSHTVTLNNAGSSGTNANVQPYLVVKMWQRTA